MKTIFNYKLMRKCLILIVMVIGLIFVASNNNFTQLVAAAAPCEQECEELKSMCLDDCAYGALSCEPNSTDTACASCISSCSSAYNACMGSAIWCGDYGPTYEGQCQVNFGTHCPIINDQVRCDIEQHYGYSLVCQTLGNNHCVKCPDHDYCVTDELESCP